MAGTVLEESFESASLARYSSRGSEVHYTIYLPDNYAGAEQSFPVVYLLHGSGGSEWDWLDEGGIADS